MSLRRRLERLEAALGDEECPRCSGTVMIYIDDELESIIRHGRVLTPEEAEAFESEEEKGGCCPVCGAECGPAITIGGP